MFPPLMGLLNDGPEYQKRTNLEFRPPTVTYSQLKAALPQDVFIIDSRRGILTAVRDLAFGAMLFYFATNINSIVRSLNLQHPAALVAVRMSLWLVYWFFQSVVGAGIFCLGHEAGHGNIAVNKTVNHTIGFVLHTVLLIPYFAWQITHHAHHRATGSLTRDENYVPKTRQQIGLPAASRARTIDYMEVLEETPLATLLRVFVMQSMGWWMYLFLNSLGSPLYPAWTNHFDPDSPLFRPSHRNRLIFSNIVLSGCVMALWYAAQSYGVSTILKLYGVPYLLTNHWIVFITYLQHTDPTLPHYNEDEWTWLRGALASVDRPLLGWMGRFFLHNISHDHVAHHIFNRIPFYHAPRVTEALKPVLGDDYNYDSTNTAYAFWRSFNECVFVEDDEPIAFYKNKRGVVARKVIRTDDSRAECL